MSSRQTPHRRIGVFGGSFDPVHAGHLMLASWIAQTAAVDEVWLSLSPQNPLKQDRRMASDADRLAMLEMAVGGCERLKLCTVELSMPRPNYTINTLHRLRELHPDCDFTLIVGGDNLAAFDRWKDHELLLRDYGLIVYPRPGYPMPQHAPGVTPVNAPQVDISSSWIRQCLARGLDMNYFLPPGVYRYIRNHNLYTDVTNQQ